MNPRTKRVQALSEKAEAARGAALPFVPYVTTYATPSTDAEHGQNAEAACLLAERDAGRARHNNPQQKKRTQPPGASLSARFRVARLYGRDGYRLPVRPPVA